MALWMWKYGDFEFYHGMHYMLSREERGNSCVPAFYKIPRHSASVRFMKSVILDKEETITIVSEGVYCLSIDGVRQKPQEQYLIPAGEHSLTISVGNANGMCALWVEGKTIVSDESWTANVYDNDEFPVGTSILCNDRNCCPGDFQFPEEECPAVRDEIIKGERIIDFGRESIVHLFLTDVKGEISVFYGESLEETYSDRCVIVDHVKEDTELHLRACRYLRFTGAVDFTFRATMPILPQSKASFSGDKKLTEIWQTAAYTLALCSRLFYLDGIKRDRWPWAGDSYISMHADAYSFADTDIMRRTMLVLRGESDVHYPVNNILEFSFYWCMMLADYYTYTNDLDFICRNYENARRLIEYYIEKRDSHGFIPPMPGVWLFIDWHPMDKNGDVCVVQMLFYRSLCAMSEIATLCKMTDDAERYSAMASELATKIEEAFWRDDLGAYVSVFRENEKINEVRRHQNILAILFGLADENRAAGILETVLHNPEIPPLTTSFYKFFEYDVLCRYGFIKEAFSEIRRYYGGMLELGATSFWEEFNENEEGVEHYAMYGDPFDRSLCHAWGASSLYFIGRYLAGVKPLLPGWQKYEVKPCLTMGDFSATVPIGDGCVNIVLENGTLTVLSDRDDGCLMVGQKTCQIPKNQKITIKV